MKYFLFCRKQSNLENRIKEKPKDFQSKESYWAKRNPNIRAFLRIAAKQISQGKENKQLSREGRII